MSEHETTNQRGQNALFFVLICFCILFIASYTSRIVERGRVQHEANVWEERIANAKGQQAELQKKRAYVQSEAYIAEVARDELNLMKEGDEVIVVLPNVVQPTAVPALIQPIAPAESILSSTTTAETPIWREWLALFTQEE